MLGFLYYYLNKNIKKSYYCDKTWCTRNERIELKDINLDVFELEIPFNDYEIPSTDEGCKELTENLFKFLMEDDLFKKSESWKSVALSIQMEDGDIGIYHSLHKSIIINRNTKFEDYWKAVSQDLLDKLIDVDVTGPGHIYFYFTFEDLTIPQDNKLEISNGIGKLVKNTITPFKLNRIGLKRKNAILGPSYLNKREIHTTSCCSSNNIIQQYPSWHDDLTIFLAFLTNSNDFDILFRILTDQSIFQLEEIKEHKGQNYRRHYLFGNLGLISENPIDFFKELFYSLVTNDDFNTFSKHKLVMLRILNTDASVFTIHHNILINEFTTFEDYYEECKEEIFKLLESYLSLEDIVYIDFLVLNIEKEMISNPMLKLISSDDKATFEHGLIIRGKHPLMKVKRPFKKIRPIKLNIRQVHLIKPITIKQKHIHRFACIDIETVSIDNIQYPVAISFYYTVSRDKPIYKLFIIDYKLFKNDRDEAIRLLWSEFFKFISINTFYKTCKTIFAHNLGSFDGFFLYKALMNHYTEDRVNILVDDQNKFVCLQLKPSPNSEDLITFKDSYRLFPVSLDNLCKSFDVDGKISKYNPDFNDIDKTFSSHWKLKNFKDYALQDSRALYNSLIIAQKEYFDKYQVDITSIFSTSSLSLKIFRSKFLKEDITILSNKDDEFIRKGYLGGATDYYKTYARLVFYYDVNSLYPFAMKMKLPNNPIRRYDDMSDIKLENFFGFALAEIHCPDSVPLPLLPYKDPETNRTIHPKGNWKGVYYSEELKAVSKIGYQIKLLEGIEFSQFRPFDEYIDHFYDLKKNSTGGTRFIAKMQLNQLYGIFGRRQELIRSINTSDLTKYAHYKIKSVIDSGSQWSTLLLVDNKYPDQCVTNISDLFEKNNDHKIIKSNVAIAAAVTANARIIMNVYKLAAGESLLYTDTDSMFTTKPLDPELIGKALGMMKDELGGRIIDEAYFFGIKKYGYRIGDEVFSVFAGIKRNSLTWQNILDINDSKTVESLQKNVFFKSLSSLNIEIKNRNILIKKDSSNIKIKNGNNYLPPVIK